MEAVNPPEKTVTIEVSKEAILDLESNTRCEYDPWLLDDHPLRSYPTECIPGLSAYLDEAIGKRKATFLRAGCLLIACLAAFQCARLLPTSTNKTFLDESTPSLHMHSQNGACTFPRLDTRPHALKTALSGGCEGLRTAVWMYHGELQIGNAVAGPGAEGFLQRFGLDPSLRDLDAGDDAPARVAEYSGPLGSFPADRAGTFLLLLDAKTSLHALYPYLVEQLDTLRQRGYLSHWNGQNFVQRPVTVVVTGEAVPERDCINHSYSDIFWSALPDGRVTSGFTTDDLRRLVPVCIL